MTCDVEHAMVESKAVSNTQTRYKYLRVAQAFKNQFSSERFKKAKTRARESRRLVFTRQILNHRQPKLQNHYFHKKTRTGFCLERFSKIIFGIHIEGRFFLVN